MISCRDNTKLVRENLESLLEIHLPTKAGGDNLNGSVSSTSSFVCECGICYAYEINVGTSYSSHASHATTVAPEHSKSSVTLEGQIPDQICSNPKCSKMYHLSCLVEWLQSLPTSKSSFGTVFGKCPYCQESISARMSSK